MIRTNYPEEVGPARKTILGPDRSKNQEENFKKKFEIRTRRSIQSPNWVVLLDTTFNLHFNPIPGILQTQKMKNTQAEGLCFSHFLYNSRNSRIF